MNPGDVSVTGARADAQSPGRERSIWWHLAMKFHMEPHTGHSVGKARDCWMCQQFAAIHEGVLSRQLARVTAAGRADIGWQRDHAQDITDRTLLIGAEDAYNTCLRILRGES